MLDSNHLAEMTASFLNQGGQIEKHDIIIRDWQHPTKTGFMRPSSNDKPKQSFPPPKPRPKIAKPRKPRQPSENSKRLKIIEMLKSDERLTAKKIAKIVDCDLMYIYMISREINVPVAANHDRQVSEVKDRLRAAMYKGESMSNADLVKLTGASPYMVNRTAREVGFKLEPSKSKVFHDAIGRIQAMDTASMTKKQITQELGCTDGHTRRLLKRFNLPFKGERS